MNSATFQARIDNGLEDERALEWTTGGVELQTRLVTHLIPKLTLDQMLDRIRYSPFASQLIEHLVRYYGATPEILNRIMDRIRADVESWLDRAPISAFADLYWPLVFKQHLAHQDYRRAWDDIKRMINLNETDVAVPHRSVVENLIRRLYHELRQAKKIGEITFYDSVSYPTPQILPGLKLLRKLEWSRYHGAISVSEPHRLRAGVYHFTDIEQLLLFMAKHFADKHNVKRNRRRAQRAMELE